MTAVVVAYNPDEQVLELVDAARRQCSDVIVVDNTPRDQESAAEGLFGPAIRVLRPGENGGLAHALNLAAASLRPACEALLLLDQDSMLPPGTVARLLVHLRDPSVAAAAPLPVDEVGRPYARVAGRGERLVDCEAVMTSGMLVRRTALTAALPFREDFFVDWVDNDFCFRLTASGLRIVQDNAVPLPHSVGERVHLPMGRQSLRVLRYAPWRHYWIMRNAVILIREHGMKHRRWACQAVLYVSRQLLTALANRTQARASAVAITHGLLDGLTGRARHRYLPPGAVYRCGHPRASR